MPRLSAVGIPRLQAGEDVKAVDVYRKVAGGNCRLLGFELNDAAILAFSAIGISAVSDC